MLWDESVCVRARVCQRCVSGMPAYATLAEVRRWRERRGAVCVCARAHG